MSSRGCDRPGGGILASHRRMYTAYGGQSRALSRHRTCARAAGGVPAHDVRGKRRLVVLYVLLRHFGSVIVAELKRVE